MCGICGTIALGSSPPDPTRLAPMLAALRHRGPDAEGSFAADRVCRGGGGDPEPNERMELHDDFTCTHQRAVVTRETNCRSLPNGPDDMHSIRVKDQCIMVGRTQSDTCAFFKGLLGTTGATVFRDRECKFGEFFFNRDWLLSAAVATVLLLILVVPIMIFQHYQAADEGTK